MKNIILVSHGTLAKGVYEAANMIYGELLNINYLCLEKNMGIDLFKEKLSDFIDSLKEAEQIIVLADLKGGSPYTSALTLLSDKGLLEKSKIISGLNLPMILSVLFIEDKFSDKEVEEIINSAQEGISEFKLEENSDDDI